MVSSHGHTATVSSVMPIFRLLIIKAVDMAMVVVRQFTGAGEVPGHLQEAQTHQRGANGIAR